MMICSLAVGRRRLALLFLGDVADLLKRLRLPDSPLTMAAPSFPRVLKTAG